MWQVRYDDPLHQMHSPTMWEHLPHDVAQHLETAFKDGSPGVFAATHQQQIYYDFTDMTSNFNAKALKIRRSVPQTTTRRVQFERDHAEWDDYDAFASNTILDARDAGFTVIGLHIDPYSYVICFNSNTQTNLDTGRVRQIRTPTTYTTTDDTDDTDDLDAEAPHEYKCPITHALLRRPTLIADGHTYERSAIQQWLRSHDTSPLTGQRLTHLHLTDNIMAKQLVRTYIQHARNTTAPM